MIPHRDRGFRRNPKIGHLRSETPVTLLRKDRSRSIGIVGHVAPETSVTLVRNTQEAVVAAYDESKERIRYSDWKKDRAMAALYKPRSSQASPHDRMVVPTP